MGGLSPISSPPPPPLQGSNVREVLGMGLWGCPPPTHNPHDTLCLLRYVLWGKEVVENFPSWLLCGRFPNHLQVNGQPLY